MPLILKATILPALLTSTPIRPILPSAILLQPIFLHRTPLHPTLHLSNPSEPRELQSVRASAPSSDRISKLEQMVIEMSAEIRGLKKETVGLTSEIMALRKGLEMQTVRGGP